MISPAEAVISLVVIAFLIAFAVARIQGRRSAASCCAPADPRRDLRMRDAYADEDTNPRDPR